MKKSLQEVLSENKARAWKEEQARLKKQQKKEQVLAIIIGIFIMASTVGLLVSMNNYNDSALDQCMAAGHTETYCIENL